MSGAITVAVQLVIEFGQTTTMPNIDLFDLYRYMLGWVVTIYASIITWQSLYGWYIYLTAQDRYVNLLRQYVIVQGLRLRFRAFWGDLIICILLCIAFIMLWHAHNLVYDWGDKLQVNGRLK